jgi:hypothetical protein
MSLDAEKVTCAKCIGKMIREGIVKIVFVKNPSTFEPEDTPARDDPFWKTEPIDKHLPGYKESLVQIPITEAEKLAKYKNASFHFKDLGYEK